jgi:hypothetical protein
MTKASMPERDQIVVLRRLAAAYTAVEPQSVAVVGNAPLSPSAERAEAIDAADVVIRVNGFALDRDLEAPTVGSRTTVVVFNRALRASPSFFERYRERLYLMLEPGRLHWEPETWPHWWPRDFGYVVVSNESVVLPLSDALGLESRRLPVWSTTGTAACWLASELFPTAHLIATGFSFIDQPDQSAWEHSWGLPSLVGAEHVIARESALLRSWIEAGRVSVMA